MLARTSTSPTATGPLSPPGDATLSVAKAARVLGVHANTVRAWSDAGRLRYYRINGRGDRRYRLADLQRFLAATEAGGPGESAGAAPGRRGREGGATEDGGLGVRLLADLAEIAADPSGLDPVLDEACRRIRRATGAALVGIWERRPGGLLLRSTDAEGVGVTQARALTPDRRLFDQVLERDDPVHARPGIEAPSPALGLGTDELLVRIPGPEVPWGVLVVAGGIDIGREEGRLLAMAIARTLGVLVRGASGAEEANGRLRRSEALRRVATDLAARLDIGDVVRDLSDHARILLGADRVAVVLRDAEGRVSSPGSVGFSEDFLAAVRRAEQERDPRRETPGRQPDVLVGPGAERGVGPVRAAAVQEGVATLLAAPLVDGHDHHGMLYVARDGNRRWSEADADAAEALAGDAAIAVRSARTFSRMATWAAQLQSIQRLGGRLSGLNDVPAIGRAIATELRQMIDYEDARVYRVRGEELVPVALMGYGDATAPETGAVATLRVGEGITGRVAATRTPLLVDDAARHPDATTPPDGEERPEASMLLAPMVHEGGCLGVVVLAVRGLREFSEDDLRLLVIYASFAGQAMANADATARLRDQSATLERRLRAQRELLRVTESILTTLDQRTVLEQITERLGSLVLCDRIVIGRSDQPGGRLVPLTARGSAAEPSAAGGSDGAEALGAWVVERNEPALVPDRRTDPRTADGATTPPGSLIAVPLIGPGGATGVLGLERNDADAPFDEEEFELVKLFAAQVSIALRNAEVFGAAEQRARTDPLTGLLNHGTFKDRLARGVAGSDPFGLVVIDLDDFKAINDTLGHQAGDRLLREIAAAIGGAARETDEVFRYGGDEFVVLLPRTDPAALASVADRMLAAVMAVGGPGSAWAREGMRVGASIGVASWPADGATAEELLLAADRACFAAKRAGRGRVATAVEGLALAAEFTISEPTPVDPPAEAGAAI